METRVEKTLEKRRLGYNCAQAVACTYCDLFGVDEDQVFRWKVLGQEWAAWNRPAGLYQEQSH